MKTKTLIEKIENIEDISLSEINKIIEDIILVNNVNTPKSGVKYVIENYNIDLRELSKDDMNYLETLISNNENTALYERFDEIKTYPFIHYDFVDGLLEFSNKINTYKEILFFDDYIAKFKECFGDEK